MYITNQALSTLLGRVERFLPKLSTAVHKFSHVFLSSFGLLSLDLIEQLDEVVACELPLGRLGNGLVVILEVEEASHGI